MFIKKLKLKNFRCFQELEIFFENENNTNRLRTLILGENGTGKSSVLKAIALVTAGSNALGELLGDVNDWIRYGTSECRIDLEMTNQEGDLRHIWLEMHKGDNLSDVIKRSDKSLNEIDAALKHTDRNYFVVGYGASRIPNFEGGNARSNYYSSLRSKCVASLLDKSARLHSIEAWAMDLDYRNKEGMEIIKRVFDDFLPNTNFHSINRKKRQLMLETVDGVIPFHALSDGYQNMASWLGDMLYRVSDIFSDRREPLKTKGVLLIDEVALHLHPMWQRELLSFIKVTLPNMQLIGTTHSPFIAQQAGRNELYTIERVNKKLQLDVFSGEPKSLLLHQILMSDVFGMNTDESLEVEDLKKNKEKILKKKKHSITDHKRLSEIERKLKDRPVKSYSNSLIKKDEHAAMKEMLKSYKNK